MPSTEKLTRLPNKKLMPAFPLSRTACTPCDITSNTFIPHGRHNTIAPIINCNKKAVPTVRNLIAFRLPEMAKAIPRSTAIPKNLWQTYKLFNQK